MEAMMEERPLEAATAHTSEVVLPDVPIGVPVAPAVDSSAPKAGNNDGLSHEEVAQFEADMHEFLRQHGIPPENTPEIHPSNQPVDTKEAQLPVAPVPPVDAAAQSYRRAKPKPADPGPGLTRPPIVQPDSTAPENAYRRKPSTKPAVGSVHTVNGIAAPGPMAAAAPVRAHAQPAAVTARATEKSKTQPTDPATEMQQHANPIYERPVADHATNNYRCIGIGASPIENDRQLVAAMSQHQQAVAQRRVSVTPKRAVDNGLFSTITGYLGIAPAAAEEEVEEVSTGAKAAAEVRELKVRLSMDDPLLAVESRRAHQLFVQGASLTDLKAAGVRASHLLDIGVNYSAFETAGMGVRDLLFLEATWEDIVAMG